MAGLRSQEGDEPTELELTYSITSGINRVDPAPGMLIVCIIQVTTRGADVAQANKIREFAFDRYIKPARAKRENTIAMRAGDIAKEMFA